MFDYEITPLHSIAHIPMPCCNEIAEQLQDNGTFREDFSTFTAILVSF